MSRYISDQNKLVMKWESGTYAVTSGTVGRWVGEVQDHSLDDAEGYIEDYFLGNNSRSVARYERGPNDVTGTISFHPIDMNLVSHTIGSVQEVVAATTQHVATEISTSLIQNPFISGTGIDLNTPYSFSLEDSKQVAGTGTNFVRTINGATVSNVKITASQGEKVTCDVDYIAQSVQFSSGTATTVTIPAQRPYLWSDATLTIAGSTISTAKKVSLNINQNVEGPHYINGSRVIGKQYYGNRQYELSTTADLDSNFGGMLYGQFYKGGSTLNYVLDFNADLSGTTGSQHAIFTVSGARITSMELPSAVEGINETTFVVSAGSLSFIDYTNPTLIGSYNPY